MHWTTVEFLARRFRYIDFIINLPFSGIHRSLAAGGDAVSAVWEVGLDSQWSLGLAQDAHLACQREPGSASFLQPHVAPARERPEDPVIEGDHPPGAPIVPSASPAAV